MTLSATPKRVTIEDVAREAGVSAATVSRALSKPQRVSADTAARVFRAADVLGYRRDGSSHSAFALTTKTFAFICPTLDDPAFGRMFDGFQAESEAHGYHAIALRIDRANIDDDFMDALRPHLMDGLALASTHLCPSAVRKLERIRPLVLIHHELKGHDSVVPDIPSGIDAALEHLTALGHSRILYISGDEDSWSDVMRWRAIHHSAHTLGLEAFRTPNAFPRIGAGLVAASGWHSRRCTAVITFNDPVAVGFIRGVRLDGYDVPRDVSVISFDDSLYSELLTPPLTSIKPGHYELGRRAAEVLLARMQNRASRVRQTHTLPMSLIVRSSTGPKTS